MLKTSNNLDYIQIKIRENGIAEKIIFYNKNGDTYKVGNAKYKIYANNLYIKTYIENSLGYKYNLKGFKVVHDLINNETILIKKFT